MSTSFRFALAAIFPAALLLSACFTDEPIEEAAAEAAATQTSELEFGGVGVSLLSHHGTVMIMGVQEGSPAEEAGIRVHDVVLSIDDMPLDGLDLSSVTELARGEVGTDVTYEIHSLDGTVRSVTMERAGMALTENERRMELRRDRDFGGVGISIVPAEDGGALIQSIFEGLPAEQAGLQVGERIVAVDGIDLTDQPVDALLIRIRGEAGTPVSLDVVSEDGERRSVTLARESIVLPGSRDCQRP